MRYLITLLILLWSSSASAGTLLLWPKVPDKPVIDLKVVDKEIDRKMTKDELTKESLYDTRKENFKSIQRSLKGTMTGKYSQIISRKGPEWSKGGITYTIAYFADLRRIKKKLRPSGDCTVINTGKISGAEWLRKNGYTTKAMQ